MAWVEKASTIAGSNSAHITVTTSAIDTTGADLIVAVISHYGNAAQVGDLTDSKGNTWNKLTSRSSSDSCIVIFWSTPSSVGSGHTFTFARGASTSFPVLSIFAVSGSAPSPFDQENGIIGGASIDSLQPGSITPTQNGELIVSGFVESVGAGVVTIDLGFTMEEYMQPDGSFDHVGGGLASKVQTTAAAINPTWDWFASFGSPQMAGAVIASFKAADDSSFPGFQPGAFM